MFSVIDTHTHFDMPIFATHRVALAQQAYRRGVKHLVVAGYIADTFSDIVACQQQLAIQTGVPKVHICAGLHPFYVWQHQPDDLSKLADFLSCHTCVALGEIGLDTFTATMKQPEVYARQMQLFQDQLVLAKQHQLPALLHIRKAHADAIKLLKRTQFNLGGIAHSFSGGEQEAKALIQLGFKISITGQVCNPNAKKLRRVVQAVGVDNLVIETDSPDMLPQPLYPTKATDLAKKLPNVPANLTYVFDEIADLYGKYSHADKIQLAQTLWHNSCQALHVAWRYPNGELPE